MIYRVFSEYKEQEKTLALCKDRKIAGAYLKYLEKEKEKDQKEFFSMKREYTFYGIREILEDEDIIKLIDKKYVASN